jgi:hypothetical protein
MGPMPPQPPFPRGPEELPEPTRKLATWALVLACIPICLTFIAGAAMAIVVLTSRGRHAGRGLAIGALAMAGFWCVAAVGFIVLGVALDASEPDRASDGEVEQSQEVTTDDVAEGDCVIMPPGDTVYTVEVLPCAEPHDAEAFAVWSIDGEEYPGSDEVDALVDAGCAQRFASFVGIPYADSELETYILYPSAQSWAFDSRGVTCFVQLPGDDKVTTGTLKGAGR